MINYIIRRLLLMPLTLFGITVMVFCIARFAPGKPGLLQSPDATLDAEQQQALVEWYEKRYGLNDPLPVQYINWWKGMFTRDIQATAWFDKAGLAPVFTLRQPPVEYFVNGDDGRWYQLLEPDFGDDGYGIRDPRFRDLVTSGDLEAQPQRRAGYAPPMHTIVESELIPIESLDLDLEDGRIERAVDRSRVEVDIDAPAWTDKGQALYVNPEDPQLPLFERDGAWYTLEVSSTNIYPITDTATLTPILGREFSRLPQRDENYAIPRHAIVYGRPDRFPGAYSVGQLERLTVATQGTAPAGIWLRQPDRRHLSMVWQAADPQPPLLIRSEDGSGWQRLIGDTRASGIDSAIIRQSALALDAMTLEDRAGVESANGNGRREPRHALLRGALVEFPSLPNERQLRRYKHGTTIFEMTLGESIQTSSTVVEELRDRLPRTLTISLVAFPLIYIIAIPCGMLMAIKRGRILDTTANVTLLGMWSVPTVLSATLFIGYLAMGGAWLEIFPSNGWSSIGSEHWTFLAWLGDRLWHLVLPVACIVYGGFAYLAKQMRAAMLDNFTMDYVRTAKAKGVRSKDVLFRHVLRNSLLPIITIFATVLPVLIAGSIIIETIFNIEGMGLLAFRAVQSRDYDVVQALALIAGILNLTGLLLADICYAVADPRISYQ